VVEFWKAQGQAQYQEKFLETPKEDRESSGGGGDDSGEISAEDNDPLFNDAVRLVIEFGKASTSLLQRRLRIGYGARSTSHRPHGTDGIVAPPTGPSRAKCSSGRLDHGSGRVDAVGKLRFGVGEKHRPQGTQRRTGETGTQSEFP